MLAACGLVGHTSTSSAITACYATGDVAGEGRYVGGLAGQTDGAITASYATGTVTGESDYVGGLVGYVGYGGITNSYAVGRVTGGGLAGSTSRSRRVVHSYWDTQTSGVSSSSSGIGKTTRELQAPTGSTGIYSRWNADRWDFGTRSQYPVLKYEGMDVAAQRQ